MATWNFDTTHASADFAVRHMMVTIVRGSIKGVTGTVEYDPENPGASKVTAQLESATIFSGLADRDNHLRSADFLDAENHPYITFTSTRVELLGDTEARVHGDLTIRGVTRPVVVEAEQLGIINSPFGDQRVGFTGTAKINREDWGLTWNMALEAGGVLVGKEVKIELNVEAIRVVEPVRA
jgi:polyisoprenoid-binding protein YceI